MLEANKNCGLLFLMEAQAGIEPAYAALQAAASPLCHRASLLDGIAQLLNCSYFAIAIIFNNCRTRLFKIQLPAIGRSTHGFEQLPLS